MYFSGISLSSSSNSTRLFCLLVAHEFNQKLDAFETRASSSLALVVRGLEYLQQHITTDHAALNRLLVRRAVHARSVMGDLIDDMQDRVYEMKGLEDLAENLTDSDICINIFQPLLSRVLQVLLTTLDVQRNFDASLKELGRFADEKV